MGVHRSDDPRLTATVSAIPAVRARPEDAGVEDLGLAAMNIDLHPDAAESAWLMVLLEELEPMLGEGVFLEAKRWLQRGSYSSVFTLLEGVVAAEPRNVSLHRITGELRAGVLRLLERRIGGRHRRVLARAGMGELGPQYRALLELARERPTIGELVSRSSLPEIEVLEHLAQLASRGWLMLAPLTVAPSPR